MAWQELLKAWNMERYISKFEEEEIDDLTFKLLDNETINKIFPKAGPRLMFMEKFNLEFPKKQEFQVLDRNTISNFEPQFISCSSTPSASTSKGQENVSLIFPPDHELDSLVSSNIHNPKDVLSQQLEEKLSEVFGENTLCSLETSQEPPLKKISLFPLGLKNFLENTVEGKIILNNSKLDHKKRGILVRLVVSHLLNTHKELNSKILSQVAGEIVSLFPSEQVDTYFISYLPKTTSRPKRNPSGKLWSKYCNLKQCLKNSDESSAPSSPFSEATNEEDEYKFELLKNVTEPHTRVLELWEDTYELRKEKLKNLTTLEIFDKIPSLKTQFGADLIDSDFNRAFPEQADLIYQKLPVICAAVLQEADDRKIVAIKENIIDPMLKAIFTLPFLFPPPVLRHGKKTFRCSRTEIQESFFVNLEVIRKKC